MNSRRGTGKYYKFIAYIIVIVLVNIVGMTLFFRADLTSRNIYSLSEASREAVANLSEPLTINVFFTKNLPAPHNNTERYLRDLLEEYSVHSNDYFNYRFYNVSPKEGDIDDTARRNQQLAHSYGVYPVQIRSIEQDEVQFKKAYMGMAMIHGDVIEKIPSITGTEGLEYKITSKIEMMNSKISALLNLEQPIKVKLYYSPSLELIGPKLRMEGLKEIPSRIESAVNGLNDKYYSRLEYRVIDPSADPSAAEDIERHNVMTLRWPDLEDDSGNIAVPSGEGAIGIVVEGEEEFRSIELINVIKLPFFGTQYQLVDISTIEESIGEAVDDVIDINKKIGYLADHGTIPLTSTQGSRTPSLDNFNTLMSKSYSVTPVNLGEEGISDGIDCLIIAGPREKFSDYELFEIDQFLMKGNSVAFFLDPFNEMTPSQEQMAYSRGPVYSPIKTGLEELLAGYGVQVDYSYVLDEECYEQNMPQMYGGGRQKIYFAPMIQNESINNRLDFMRNIKGLVTLKAAPVGIIGDSLMNNDLSGEVLFSTSDRAWTISERINLNPLMTRPPADPSEFDRFPLAVYLEGEFPSHFIGREIPVKAAEGDSTAAASGDKSQDVSGERPFVQKGRAGMIFATGSSEVLKNTIMDETGEAPTSTFILNLVDKLNDREAYAKMRSKTQRFNPLNETTAGVKTFVKTFNMAGLPVLVVIFGIIVWMRRESRKKNIQKMFER